MERAFGVKIPTCTPEKENSNSAEMIIIHTDSQQYEVLIQRGVIFADYGSLLFSKIL